MLAIQIEVSFVNPLPRSERKYRHSGNFHLPPDFMNDLSSDRARYNDGLRETDVIIAVAGAPQKMSTREFNVHIKLRAA